MYKRFLVTFCLSFIFFTPLARSDSSIAIVFNNLTVEHSSFFEFAYIALSPDEHSVVSGSSLGDIILFNLQTGQREQFIEKAHDHWTYKVAFSKEGHYVLSGSPEGLLKLWDIRSGQNVQTFSKHSAAIQAIAISPNGQRAASGDSDIGK